MLTTKDVTTSTVETLLFSRLNECQPRRHLRSHFNHAKAQQQSDILPRHDDAPGRPEHDQRAAISFFYAVVINKLSIDMYCT